MGGAKSIVEHLLRFFVYSSIVRIRFLNQSSIRFRDVNSNLPRPGIVHITIYWLRYGFGEEKKTLSLLIKTSRDNLPDLFRE